MEISKSVLYFLLRKIIALSFLLNTIIKVEKEFKDYQFEGISNYKPAWVVVGVQIAWTSLVMQSMFVCVLNPVYTRGAYFWWKFIYLLVEV